MLKLETTSTDNRMPKNNSKNEWEDQIKNRQLIINILQHSSKH